MRDPAVEAVCESLESAALVGRGDAVVHLAGMLGNDVLAIAHDAGALTGALHPLVAVADPKRPPTLDGAALSFEGDAPLARWLAKLFAPTGARVFRLAQVDRVRYHAAAALCATGAVALAQGAAALFAEAARDADADAIRAFTRSLLASAAHNVFVAGPSRALASPIMRGDTATVERHLASMRIAPRARAMYAAALLQAVDTLAREQSVAPAVLTAVQRMARKSSR